MQTVLFKREHFCWDHNSTEHPVIHCGENKPLKKNGSRGRGSNLAGESQVTKLWEAPYILKGTNNQKITERHRTAQAHLKSRVTRRMESIAGH
jgi:hypothetical protein